MAQRVSQTPGAKAPTLCVADDGRVFVAFGAGDTLYGALSRDGGRSFGAERAIGAAGKLSLGMRRGPRVAWGDGALTVSAVWGAQGGGRDGDLLALRSVDGGGHWSEPARVNDVVGSAREGLHAMAASPDGKSLACAWLDLRQKGTTVYASLSRDAGRSWSANALVYRSPDGTVCQCCHTSVAFARDGALLVLFRNVLRGDRDMYLCRSDDHGRTFGPAQKLGLGRWPLDACPMDGGMVGALPGGRVASVWRREGTVYACAAGSPEVRLEDGQQPWLAVGADGPWYAWLSGGRPGALHLLAPRGRIVELARVANDPVLAASPNGKRVVAAWTGPDGIEAETLA